MLAFIVIVIIRKLVTGSSSSFPRKVLLSAARPGLLGQFRNADAPNAHSSSPVLAVSDSGLLFQLKWHTRVNWSDRQEGVGRKRKAGRRIKGEKKLQTRKRTSRHSFGGLLETSKPVTA